MLPGLGSTWSFDNHTPNSTLILALKKESFHLGSLGSAEAEDCSSTMSKTGYLTYVDQQRKPFSSYQKKNSYKIRRITKDKVREQQPGWLDTHSKKSQNIWKGSYVLLAEKPSYTFTCIYLASG